MLSDILGDNTDVVQQYVLNCTKLVKSLLIVSHDEAGLYNDQIKLVAPRNSISEDKKEWRYYKHLVGLKDDSIDTDITLISIDTSISFALSRETLSANPATKAELLKFGYMYDALVAQYKSQEQYILACLLPLRHVKTDGTPDVGAIVNLPHLSIVSYEPSLIEENEYDLIYELQTFIENYKVSWMIAFYNLSDPLFLAAQYQIFFLALVQKVLALRLAHSGTFQAHSYHIKNYLASHHYLDDYYEYMTPKQRYFFYKNILYLDNHAGSTKTYKELVAKLFTDRNISLFNFNFVQTNELANNDIVVGFDKKYVNVASNSEGTVYPLGTIKNVEADEAVGNTAYWESNTHTVTESFKQTKYSRLPTKDLEISVGDSSDTVAKNYVTLLVNYLGALVAKSLLQIKVSLNNPKANSVSTVTAKDAYVLLMLALHFKFGIQPPVLPTVKLFSVYRDGAKNQLTSNIVKTNYTAGLESHAELLKGSLPDYPTSVDRIITVAGMSAFVQQVYETEKGFWIYTSDFSDMHLKGQIKQMLTFFYEDIYIDLSDPTSQVPVSPVNTQQYLATVGFNELFTFNLAEVDTLITNILDAVSNGDYSNLTSHVSVQQAMADIFQTLSSYNIQFTNSFVTGGSVIAGAETLSYAVTPDTWIDPSVLATKQTELTTLFNRQQGI